MRQANLHTQYFDQNQHIDVGVGGLPLGLFMKRENHTPLHPVIPISGIWQATIPTMNHYSKPSGTPTSKPSGKPTGKPAESREHFSAAIERVTFHSEESGFCVLRVKAKGHRDLVTVTGSAATVTPGEFIDAMGVWVNDKTYGLQFKAEVLQIVPPTTLEGIEKYLGSGMVKGIGPHFAKKLVMAFGEAVFEVIEETPERLQGTGLV